MKDRIEQAAGNPAAMERLYRQAVRDGQEHAFCEGLKRCHRASPDDVLLSAWALRLELAAPAAEDIASAGSTESRRRWSVALAISTACGVLFALFADGKPPVPVPGVASRLFWLGWAPLAAVAILAFVALSPPRRQRLGSVAGAAAAAIALGLAGGMAAWGRADAVPTLIALHVPFLAWAAIGAGLIWGCRDRAEQFYAFLVESMEALLAGAVFLVAGGILGGLSAGIFAVLGLRIPEAVVRAAAAFGIGAIPVLAVASVYDPALPPARQGAGPGLARIVRIMSWLLLPAALGVLGLYVVWFIPAYFWKPFQQRDALIVYNATIIAVLVLLAAAVSPAGNPRTWGSRQALRVAVLALGVSTLLLNLYALAAVVSRTLQYGLSPNRHAVLGWNLVTLLMLAFMLVRSRRAGPERWLRAFRAALAGAMALAVAWAAWVVVGLPYL